MALVTKRQCDVFKTTREVESYVVKVFVKSEGSKLITVESEDESDLSPRGLARLKKFIRRGLTAPGVNSTQTEHEGATHEADRQGRD